MARATRPDPTENTQQNRWQLRWVQLHERKLISRAFYEIFTTCTVNLFKQEGEEETRDKNIRGKIKNKNFNTRYWIFNIEYWIFKYNTSILNYLKKNIKKKNKKWRCPYNVDIILYCLVYKVFHLPPRQRAKIRGERVTTRSTARRYRRCASWGAFRGPDYVNSAYTRAFIQYLIRIAHGSI